MEAVAGEEIVGDRGTERGALAEAQLEAVAADCVPDSHTGHSRRPSRTVVHSPSFRRRARSRHAVARTRGAPPEQRATWMMGNAVFLSVILVLSFVYFYAKTRRRKTNGA